jgi:hypothetical protein
MNIFTGRERKMPGRWGPGTGSSGKKYRREEMAGWRMDGGLLMADGEWVDRMV